MNTLVLCALLILAASFPLCAQEHGTYIEVRGKGAFLAQPTGTLAYLRDALSEKDAKATYRNQILKSGRSYILPSARKALYFRINHRSDGLSRPTYLGVQIIRFHDHGHSATEPVYVFRNEDWFSEGLRLPSKEITSEVSVNRFSEHHALLDHPEELHNDLQTKWHASIDRSGKPHSWDKKIYWNLKPLIAQPQLDKAFGNNIPDNFEITADCRLIRFTQSESPITAGIHFYLTPGSARAILLRTFTPDTRNYDNLVYLSFAK